MLRVHRLERLVRAQPEAIALAQLHRIVGRPLRRAAELDVLAALRPPQLGWVRGQAPHLLSRDDDEACHLTVGLSDPSLCAALGRPDRADVLLNSAAGASLRQANASGSVGGLLFCEWWLAEDVAEQLHSGLSKSFPSGLELLERSASNAFRYRLQRGEGGPLSLADVFGEVEDAKDALRVAEYAVGQTTLEQVFVEFASSQENPENR